MAHSERDGATPPAAAAGLAAALRDALAATVGERGGSVADYIPRLAEVDPELYGLAICGGDGVVTEVGDSQVPFSMQSTSKPFAYALALQRFGRAVVCEKIGVEPTGRSFDSIVRLETGTHRPHNPMINAGAIAVTGMLAAGSGEEPIAMLLREFGRFAAADPHVDAATYLSERDSGDQNRAIAYLLRYHGVVDLDVDTVLDLYFQQCSVMVTVRELAVMAAALAHGGRNPVSGEQVVAPEVARDVIAVMSTCGLYDGAGAFLYEVGLPAKSGVSGAVFAVVPGRMGIAAWSPRLDPRGNPVRGVAAVRHLSSALGLHVFAPRNADATAPTVAAWPRDLREFVAEVAADEGVDLSIAGVDGNVAQGGEPARFPMQATANAFGHALALQRHGAARIEQLVGVEASGNPFHEIFLDVGTNRPHNPLGNAGAIAIASTVPGQRLSERVTTQLRDLARLAGVPQLEVDAVVLAAERRDGDRNRAIASLLRNHGVIEDIQSTLELYFHQCSIRLGTPELARMAAVLANGGLDPVTGDRLLSAEVVRQTLSVMYSCGLHDETGRFAFDVGLPAKSGVSGAIVAVVPGRAGIAVHAPGVNAHGTSTAGRRALVTCAERLQLSVFHARPDADPA